MYVGQNQVRIRAVHCRIMRAPLLTATSAALIPSCAERWIIDVWGKTALPSSILLCGMCFLAVLLVVTINQTAQLTATQQPLLKSVCAILPRTFEVRRILRGKYVPKRGLDPEPLPEVQTYGS
jgi:hypothetical protein